MIDEIVKKGKVSREFAEAVSRGAKKEELHQILSKEISQPPDSAPVDIARMNSIGGLRNVGFIVVGGRGKPYRVTGFKEPEPSKGIESWDSELRARLSWLEDQHKVVVDDREEINSLLSNNYHESSFGYIWSYELARDTGFFFEYRGEKVLVIRRFVQRPRFRIFSLSNSAPVLLSLAEEVAVVSTKPVSILNISSTQMNDFKSHRGYWSKRVEPVVRVKTVLDNLSDYFNRRSLTTLRKSFREIDYREGSRSRDHLEVLDNWKTLNLHKHRQPALTRDVVAMSADFYPWSIVGYRESVPVSSVICDRLPPPYEHISTLIVEKSLNYSQYPDGSPCVGGKYGTADANLIHVMEVMSDGGIELFNLGGIDGGGWGLGPHKRHYAQEEDDVVSLTLVTEFSCKRD